MSTSRCAISPRHTDKNRRTGQFHTPKQSKPAADKLGKSGTPKVAIGGRCAPARSGHASQMANALYELSVHLIPLENVIEQIKTFKRLAPLGHYQYQELISLLRASAKCPPEAEFLFLTIAAKMIRLGNCPNADQRAELSELASSLLRDRPKLLLHDGDQTRWKGKLKKILTLLGSEIIGQKTAVASKGGFKTEQIEKIVAEQKRRTDSGDALMVDSQLITLLETNRSETSEIVAPSELDEQEVQPRSTLANTLNPSELETNLAAMMNREQPTLGKLAESEQETLQELALGFGKWETAYKSARHVWDSMSRNPSFPLDALLSLVPKTSADFLVAVLKDLAKEADFPLD